jgi:hypothetical protein
MADTIDPRFLDKRTAERYIRLGLLDEKTWEKHLKSLPDVSDKGAEVVTAIGAGDEGEDDNGAYGGDAGEGSEESGHIG